MESMSTKERIYILKSERDFEAYEASLKSELADAEEAVVKAEATLQKVQPENEAAYDKAETAVDVAKAQVEDIKKKIALIPQKKARIEKLGPTKWKITSLGRRRKFSLMTSHGIGEKKSTSAQMGEYMCVVVEENLHGWENYRDADGNEIAFSKEAIDYIHDDVFTELFREISGAVDEEVAKN